MKSDLCACFESPRKRVQKRRRSNKNRTAPFGIRTLSPGSKLASHLADVIQQIEEGLPKSATVGNGGHCEDHREARVKKNDEGGQVGREVGEEIFWKRERSKAGTRYDTRTISNKIITSTSYHLGTRNEEKRRKNLKKFQFIQH